MVNQSELNLQVNILKALKHAIKSPKDPRPILEFSKDLDVTQLFCRKSKRNLNLKKN